MTKEQERDELHRTIWRIANDLRGSVEGWDFKSSVLGMLFYRFISENLTNYLNKEEQRAGNIHFDYTKITDEDAAYARDETVLEKKLGATVKKRNELLVKIMDSIAGLRLGDYQDNNNDTFGDAYEYLMTMYAGNAGKPGGEFFTPTEVSDLLAKITVVGKKQVNKVYDPACGSGSLLLKFAKVLGKGNVRQGFFGQEINITTYNLCWINIFLHDINYEKFEIAHGDTLREPKHWDDEPFDAIVSILDKFDALVNDTTIGIQAEIEASRKQYEYYRNKLLTFGEYA